MTLHLTRGLQASGKTTFARAWAAEDAARIRVNRDILRSMLHGGWTGDRAHEEAVTLVQQAAVRTALRAGRDVIVDDTNLNSGIVKQWLKLADQVGAAVEFHDFPIDLADAIERDKNRDSPVGAAVIERTHARYLAHLKGEFPAQPNVTPRPKFAAYVAIPGTPKAVLVDIDGTLALNTGRSPYNYTRVHEDAANQPVLEVLVMLMLGGYQPIILSGRDDSCRDATIDWLSRVAGIAEDEYIGPLMRADGDKRDDAIVKLEMFDEHIRDQFDVRYVLDDRNRVVAAWRSIGLTVLQVADGDF